MKDRVFLDTNVLVYLHSDDEPSKQLASIQLSSGFLCLTSVQALNEFCNVFLKKLHKTHEETKDAVESIREAYVVKAVSEVTILHALRLHERYGYSYYDCVMLASALENGCAKLMTEDMAAGHVIEGTLEIVNPYA